MSLMWHQYRKHVNMNVNTPHPPTHPTPYYRVKHYVAKRQNARMCAPTRSVFDPEAKTYIKPIYRYCYLLVGGLEDVDTFSIFPYIGNVIIPSDINWLSYFSEGSSTKQLKQRPISVVSRCQVYLWRREDLEDLAMTASPNQCALAAKIREARRFVEASKHPKNDQLLRGLWILGK